MVINRSEFSGGAPRKNNYPKPVTLLSREAQKKLKPDLFEAELNKGIALPMSEIRPNTEQANEMFPKPGEDEGAGDFFITEKAGEEGKEGEQVEQIDEEATDKEKDETGLQMFDDVDQGKNELVSFKERAREVLLPTDYQDTAYDAPLDLPGSYKALKNFLQKPVIVHSKRPKANYMKQTFSTSRHAIVGKVDEKKFLEFSKANISKLDESKQGESSVNETMALDRKAVVLKERQLKQDKIDQKIEAMKAATQQESMIEEEKKGLRAEYGFSDSDSNH